MMTEKEIRTRIEDLKAQVEKLTNYRGVRVCTALYSYLNMASFSLANAKYYTDQYVEFNNDDNAEGNIG